MIDEIGHEVAGKDKDRAEEDNPQQKGDVTPDTCLDSGSPQARIGEDLFRQHGAAEQFPQGGKLEGDGGQGHIAKGAPENDPDGLFPLGPGKDGIIAP